MMRRIRFRCLLLVLLAGAAASACSIAPEGGSVVPAGKAAEDRSYDDPYVRLLPRPPQRDADQVQIVHGFLTASASFDDNHAVARQYLAPGVQWRADSTTVYGGPARLSQGTVSENQAEVGVTASKTGTIGDDGQYRAEAGRIDDTFRLTKVRGQWRITTLPRNLTAGLLLSEEDVPRAFRTMNLYFLAAGSYGGAARLVPDPVYVPLVANQDLPRRLVGELLGGPTRWLAPAVRTAFPQGTQLKSMRIVGSTATVDLSRQARQGNGSDMAAQLLWTLRRQLPDVTDLNLRIDGREADIEGRSHPVQLSREWEGYSPDGLPGRDTDAYVRDASGRLALLTGGTTTRVPAWAGVDLHAPAISMTTNPRKVAGLDTSGSKLVVGDLESGRAQWFSASSGRRFTRPSWDPRGNLWTVETGGGKSRLWVVHGGSAPVRVDVWGIPSDEVIALRVARDGARAAAVVKTRKGHEVRLGKITGQGRDLKVDEFLPISSELNAVTDLAWRNADELAVLGKREKNQELAPYIVPVSGDPVRPLSVGPKGTNSIAAAPQAAFIVGGRDAGKDKIYRLNEQDKWGEVAPGSAPVYPG